MIKSQPIQKKSIKRMLIFFFVAVCISNVFRFDVFEIRDDLESLPTWLFLITSVFLEGSGLIIAAIPAIFYLKKERRTEISLFGSSVRKSLLMATVPIIILTVIGINNDFGMDPYLYGFIAIFATFIYCLMEEYGWRGYLQEELRGIKPWKKFTLIGFLWYFWHLSFLTAASLGDNLFFLGMLILGSWGIGQVAEATKSILASACFHLIIQIIMFNALIKNGISGSEKLIILVVSVSIWMLIIKKWGKNDTSTGSVTGMKE